MPVRVLALDVGSKRIGVAVSDPTGFLARSLTVIERRGLRSDIEMIAKLLRQEGAERVVVGLPLSLSGDVGPQALAVLEFKEALDKALDVSVETWDERFSTVGAQEALRAQGVRARKQRGRIDAAAAAVILQGYLDAQGTHTNAGGEAR